MPEGGWQLPKKPAPVRPMPTRATIGDHLKPSVFAQAAMLAQHEASAETPHDAGSPARSRWPRKASGGTSNTRKGPLARAMEDSDSEEWVKDFEMRYGDCCRIPPKEKHLKNKSPNSSKASAAPTCPLAPLEVIYPEEAELLVTGAEEAEPPKYTKIKVALDSGAGVHVINRRDAPGYKVNPSPMSKAGAAFLAADGGRISNYGEVHVNLMTFDSGGTAHKVTSKFEAADVTRALWSVGLICDSGLDVQFSSKKALVKDQRGNEVCVFHRENGLYVAEVQVENPEHPEGFQRPGN